MLAIIKHDDLHETPWRDRYRLWNITGRTEGISSALSYGQVEPGAGAPLHYHETDELIVILDGALNAQVGDETHSVGPSHTILIPPLVPHKFTAIGPSDARILTFFPTHKPFESTTYIEGNPPDAFTKEM